MDKDFLVIAIFGSVAVAHWLVEEKVKDKVCHIHWLIPFLHPITLEMLKDWVVHLVVYSKYALIQLG